LGAEGVELAFGLLNEELKLGQLFAGKLDPGGREIVALHHDLDAFGAPVAVGGDPQA